MSILKCFRPGFTPRPQQIEVLTEIERKWLSTDVFVIQAPVACGKSLIADCVARWTGNCGIFTPTNVLMRQYLKDMPEIITPNPAAKQQYRDAQAVLGNYYHLLSYRAYKPTVVFDEAHSLVETLRTMEAVKIWRHLHDIPDSVSTASELLIWANDNDHKKLLKRLDLRADEYIINEGWDTYRGRMREYITVEPLTPRDNAPILWPPHRTKKIILMSATFGEEDIYDLGLDTHRVSVIATSSPIPKERRPLYYKPIGNSRHENSDTYISTLKSYILDILNARSTKGFIHLTYSMAARLRKVGLKHPRLRWHESHNTRSKYNDWLAAKDNSVFLGCGLEQGIDLKGSLARWQVITKIQYPSLTDPAVKAKLAIRPKWYAWSAVRHLLQASGRVCRTPTDWGETFIVDKQFSRLYSDNKGMFPEWFKEALT